MAAIGKRKLSFHLSYVIVGMVLLVGGTIAAVTYFQNVRSLESQTIDSFNLTAEAALGKVESAYRPAEVAAEVLSRHAIMESTEKSERINYLFDLSQEIGRDDAIKSVYVGYPDGAFFMVRRITDEAHAATFDAPPETRWMIQSIERASGDRETDEGEYLFFNGRYQLLSRIDKPGYEEYDPRRRPWFSAAIEREGVIRTTAYVFFSTGEVGATLARRGESGAVAGVDLSLAALSSWLQGLKPTPSSQTVLFGQDGKLTAHSDPAKAVLPAETAGGRPRLATLEDLQGSGLLSIWKTGQSQAENNEMVIGTLTVGEQAKQSLLAPIILDGALSLYLAITVPENELFATARENARFTAMLIGALLLFAVPLTIYVSRQVARPLVRLSQRSEAIRRFDFSGDKLDRTGIIEIDQLGTVQFAMQETIRRFMDISSLITGESNFDRLTSEILNETKEIAAAKYGVLYLLSADDTKLEAAACTGGGDPTKVPAISLDTPAGPLKHTVDSLQSESVLLRPEDLGHFAVNAEESDSPDWMKNPYMVSVALTDRDGHLIGVLALLRSFKGDGGSLKFIEAISGTSAVAIETQRLIRDQKRLFQSFIELIATAVDAKSPYTGGHCERVPELTKMLAQAACDQQTGPYAGFDLDEEEWEAVHVAAWLHDCGKVTTPEFVVDKATKLETIYDRIHEIRMRFEVLKRDAEIAVLKQQVDGLVSPDRAKVLLWERLQALDEDFAFVASCNTGGEFMSEDKQDRLRAIAARTWRRTLDDRLGISHEEAERKARNPVEPLPQTEYLISDKDEHRISHRNASMFGAGNPWGFKMEVPGLLYDRGELTNLLVTRGTLTNEERFKINEHIIQTIIMLSKLPFPRHLRHVPELAGGHHEKMDGTGYPKQLHGSEMSPVARMMAIADIFEALTAVDRPYKKGKTLSEALKIMGFMVKDNHIDVELFRLFLVSGVWREYAELFLRPEQIDDVAIDDFLPRQEAAE